jgi:hypothetical protein
MVMRRDSALSRLSRHSEAAQLSHLASINAVTRDSGSASSYVDVIDRVLDKGIVIEAWIRLSVGGIDLITIEAHVIVASIVTYLEYWPELDGAAAMANRSLTVRSEHRANTFGPERLSTRSRRAGRQASPTHEPVMAPPRAAERRIDQGTADGRD